MYWEPGTQYNYGDIVEFEEHRYKIIEPHRSQSDWTPPVTPALWGRLSHNDDNCCGEKQQEGYQQQQTYQVQQSSYDQQSQNQQQYNEPPVPEEKHWYGDEATKKKLEIGGGVAAAALLAGAGLFAYKKHEQHKELAKTHDHWIQEARERRDRYYSVRSHEAATWVLTEGQTIPEGAILVGREKTWNLYICRAFHDNGIQVGKASQDFHHGAVLGYGNREVFVNEYEVLVGHMERLRWVPYSGRLNVRNLGFHPVEGGQENNGSLLYVAEAQYNGAVHPAKVGEHLDCAFVAYGGREEKVTEYRVLCYNEGPERPEY